MELFALAILTYVVMYLWMTVAAFTRSVLWGVLVLLVSPLSALAFGAGYFRDVRLPFLLYIASLGFVITAFFMISPKEWQHLCERTDGALCVYGATATGKTSATATKPINPATTPAIVPTPNLNIAVTPSPSVQNVPAAAALTPTPAPVATASPTPTAQPTPNSTDPMANFPKKHSLAKEDPLEVKRLEPEADTITITPAKVGKYLNRYLIITLRNKVERSGLLKKVDAEKLTLERKWEGKGSQSFTVYRSQIKTIRVLKKPPKE